MSERVFSQGMLSGGASYEIITKGPMGLKEVKAMIRKLKFDQELIGKPNDNAAPVQKGAASIKELPPQGGDLTLTDLQAIGKGET